MEPLLDAAEDENAIVRATACYALLNLGLSQSTGRGERPLPPLLNVQESKLVFSSSGACNAQIGALRLIDVPDPSAIHLSLLIGKLDFDPFATESYFEVRFIPSVLMAASLFDRTGRVDWIDLACRCEWIAKRSEKIANAIDARRHLEVLKQGLLQRSVDFARLGEQIAQDLGMPWNAIKPSPTIAEQISDDPTPYAQLRRVYNRTNQALIEELAKTEQPQDLLVAQSIENISGGLVIGYLIRQATARKHVLLEASTSIHTLMGGSLRQFIIATLLGSRQQLPSRLRYHGSISVKQCTGQSTISGLHAHRLLGPSGGWSADLSISIDEFEQSRLTGIAVDIFRPDWPEGQDAPAQDFLIGTNTIKAESTLVKDVVTVSGPLHIEEGARVVGSLRAVGGPVFVEGEIVGDVSVAEAELRLGPSSRIVGDLNAAYGSEVFADGEIIGEVLQTGGVLTLGPDAKIMGDVRAIGGKNTNMAAADAEQKLT